MKLGDLLEVERYAGQFIGDMVFLDGEHMLVVIHDNDDVHVLTKQGKRTFDVDGLKNWTRGVAMPA